MEILGQAVEVGVSQHKYLPLQCLVTCWASEMMSLLVQATFLVLLIYLALSERAELVNQSTWFKLCYTDYLVTSNNIVR